MAREYVVNFTNLSATGPKTLCQVKAGAATALQIIRFSLGQVGSNTATQCALALQRKTVAATVTSFTPLLMAPNDAAAKAVGGTAATGVNASAEGTNGDIIWQDEPNILGPYNWVPGKEDVWIDGAGIIALILVSGTLTNVYATFVFQEPD